MKKVILWLAKLIGNPFCRLPISVGQAEDCDGVFISCTSLRAADIIEEAEQILKKPVTASNHALAWHLLRLAGIEDQLDGLGQLFRTSLPNEKVKR